MKSLRITFLAVLTAAAAAAPLLAGPRLCANGLPPALSGDLFSPVECSTTTKPVPFLPGVPVAGAGAELKTMLKDLEGRWEGSLIHALGRYELLLTVAKGRGGKLALTLDLKELQFRERLTDRLALSPLKVAGAYEAVLTSSLAPEASLSGGAVLGAAAQAETADTPAGAPPPGRQADLAFANGALHRIYFDFQGKSQMRVRAYSGIPGAPVQKFETVLTRTKREAL